MNEKPTPLTALFDYRGALLDLAATLREKGECDEAIFILERASSHYPVLPEVHMRLAEALSEAQRWADAEAAALRAVELDSDHEAALLVYVNCLTAQSNSAEAVAVLRQALERRPSWARARIRLIELLHERKQFTEVITLGQELFTGEFKWDIAGHVGTAYLAIGESERAQTCLNELIYSGAATIEAIVQVADSLAELGAAEQAINLLTGLIKNGQNTAQVVLGLEKILSNNGAAPDALQILESGLQDCDSALLRAKAEELRNNLQQSGAHNPLLALRSEKKRIIFVSEIPKVREVKLAQALRTQGWEVALLYKKKPNCTLENFFDATFQFHTAQQALYMARDMDSPIFHVFSSNVDNTSVLFVKERPGFILFDYVDIFDGMIYNHPTHMAAQRFCCTQADGLICRDLQLAALCRMGNFQRPKHVLYYPEYCWDSGELQIRPPDGEIHVVQAGWVDVEKNCSVKEVSYYDIFRSLTHAGINVHLYRHTLFAERDLETLYSDYFELQQETGCMHVHSHVPLEQVPKELSKYDLGINVVTHLVTGNSNYRHSKNFQNILTCGSARNTDYLDACLPIITSPEVAFQFHKLKKRGVRIELTRELLENPREVLEPFVSPDVRELVRQRRAGYTIQAHSERLVRFYERCLDNY